MRGSIRQKDEKTRKSREKPSGKHPIWNTIEQYAGLKCPAASLLFEISSKKSQKGENRRFLENEQYGRLESCNPP